MPLFLSGFHVVFIVFVMFTWLFWILVCFSQSKEIVDGFRPVKPCLRIWASSTGGVWNPTHWQGESSWYNCLFAHIQNYTQLPTRKNSNKEYNCMPCTTAGAQGALHHHQQWKIPCTMSLIFLKEPQCRTHRHTDTHTHRHTHTHTICFTVLLNKEEEAVQYHWKLKTHCVPKWEKGALQCC